VILQLLFAVGGGLGAVARFGAGHLLPQRLPLATLVVNVTGSFLLGLLLSHAATQPDYLRQLLTGITGGFTTFSTFATQTLNLGQDHALRYRLPLATANVVLNLAGSVAALRFGMALF
jgi:fluoride exporter